MKIFQIPQHLWQLTILMMVHEERTQYYLCYICKDVDMVEEYVSPVEL